MNRLQTTVFLLLCTAAVQAQTVSNVKTECVQIGGVCWATRNVAKPGKFAAKPEKAGKFYQWNRNKAWSSKGKVKSWDSSYPTGSEWEKANDPCPAGFRVPTQTELQTLVAARSTWTTNYNGTSVAGRVFGSGENTVFFPAAGYRYDNVGTLHHAGVGGFYWSSAEFNSNFAYYVSFGSVSHFTRNGGLSIRCVAE
ncbi:MAG: hypothetical protein LBM68_01580 [Bacteroidales bacterium]|jgi:uncharacterized protein (TIGR02145 family)|nr:hypothetical protein [Bacteroidales bacterium]